MNNQQRKRKHHTTPVEYLKGFTDRHDPNLIWVYDKDNGNAFSTGVTGVGFVKDFYATENSDGTKDTNTVEDYLADEVEGPALFTLKKIRSQKELTIQDRHIFSEYVSVFIKRVQRHKLKVERDLPEIIDSEKLFWEQIFTEAISSGKYDQDKLIQNRERTRQLLESYKANPPNFPYAKSIVPGIIAPVIERMTWQFLIAPSGSSYITCDSPVFFTEWGLNNNLAQVTLPISSKIALFADWCQEQANTYSISNEKAVHEMNLRTAAIAVRQIYHRRQSDWIEKIIKESRSFTPTRIYRPECI